MHHASGIIGSCAGCTARVCLLQVGAAIEKALGSAQDIEGVVAPDGHITVVQTRPQV
jgi:alpha-glucan,water dikinase